MIGDKIKHLRTDRKITQKQLAEAMNMTQSAVGMWENNSRMPDIDTIRKLSSFFEVSTDYLLEAENLSPADARREAYKAMLSDFTDEELLEMKNFTLYLRWKRSHPQDEKGT